MCLHVPRTNTSRSFALEEGDHEKAVAVMIEHLDELEEQLALESEAPAEFNLKQALSD